MDDKQPNDKTAGKPASKGSGGKVDVAIAIDYNPQESSAPKVVAKGQGWLAEQIIAIAIANGIEVKEDPDLAQLLSSVDVDSEIPLEAFTAVAEILSYIYRLNNQWPDGI
ncbi:MAG: EscU/YscU/HrcU family type III secretion system export apparatus switch protein, partial [Rhodospirillaceae bacterium]|nr:EscU/YscU/HrcU family type III secretion system export apparatus switch protein [Rhodospirillaceae bacterium]